MSDFWLSCGHHLLDRDASGGLVVTDEFLKAYFARPELAPPADACPAERALHAAVLAHPRRAITGADIAAIADADARENWQLMAAFRDRLLAHATLEAAYMALMHHGAERTPPLFINQLVHAILRNVLDGCDDAFVLRAAELFFRPQRVTLYENSLLVADEEQIAGSNPAPVSPLVSMLGVKLSAGIDVLGEGNAASYWERSDRFDFALDLTAGRRGHAALAHVIARWVRHLHGTDVDVEPLVEVRDAALNWYVGLDAEASRIGDMLWNGEELDQTTRERVVSLFRLRFRDPQLMVERLVGEPVLLILAMSPQQSLRMKPQNLVTGLPIRHLEAAS